MEVERDRQTETKTKRQTERGGGGERGVCCLITEVHSILNSPHNTSHRISAKENHAFGEDHSCALHLAVPCGV